MNETFDNTADFVKQLADKYPGSEKDLWRLVARVQMDTRNAIGRTFSDMETEARMLQGTNPQP